MDLVANTTNFNTFAINMKAIIMQEQKQIYANINALAIQSYWILNMLGSNISKIEALELQQLKSENYDRIGANSATSSANSATSSANSATSGANSATSSANSATSDANSATSDGSHLLKRRMKKEELQTLMLDICQDWVSLEEVVIKANRSSSYIRNKVIPRMLEMKLLEMLYPGTPNHPNQKYKVKD